MNRLTTTWTNRPTNFTKPRDRGGNKKQGTGVETKTKGQGWKQKTKGQGWKQKLRDRGGNKN